MSARDKVLSNIAEALGRSPSEAQLGVREMPRDVANRLQGGKRHTLPYVADDLVATLITSMESVLMTVARLPTIEQCVEEVVAYLGSEGVDVSQAGDVTVAPALDRVQWPEHYGQGPASGVEKVSITPCIAAVAETGSVVTVSDGQTPATLNFLPETHIIVVRESQLVKHVDDVFPLLRSMDVMPRAVNFITGPSRTADIEQTLEIGAHGPRRMHVLLISD